MNKDSKIFVAGHRGLVGSAILKNLKAKGYTAEQIAALSSAMEDIIQGHQRFTERPAKIMYSRLMLRANAEENVIVSIQEEWAGYPS